MKKSIFICMGLLAILVGAGCGPKVIAQLSSADTPANHYFQGMKLIEECKAEEALARFVRALELDSEYAPAYAGQALVVAKSAAMVVDAEHKELDVKRFRILLKTALSRSDNDTDRFLVCTSAVRAETIAKGEDWLHAAEGWFDRGEGLKNVEEEALPYYRKKEALDYFMAVAWVEGGEYDDARTRLEAVNQNEPDIWHKQADNLYASVQKIEWAMTQHTVTDVATVIAAKKKVSRADVAALLTTELELERLFKGRLAASKSSGLDFVPADVANHPFKAEIISVLKWNVRGLEPVNDAATRAYLFKPEGALTRKAMALVLEDVLIKITGENALGTRFFGQDTSPYPDVRPTDPWYNAVVNAVSRNFMETRITGEFRPDEDLDGADLLLAVARLRNALIN